MTSNNGTQYFQQNRIYDSKAIAICLSSDRAFNPWYLVYEKNKNL